MRRQEVFAVLLAGLICAATSSLAGDPAVDFNNGRDKSGIVEAAVKKGKKRWANPLAKINEPSNKFVELDGLPRRTSVEARIEPSEPASQGRLPLPTGVACDQLPPSSDDPGGGTPALCAPSKARQPSIENPAAKTVPITGPYEPIPRDNPDYQDALALKSQLEGVGVAKPIDRIGAIPPPIRDGLLSRWPPLDSKRTELIGAARPLDADDEALSRFAFRLNVWLDNIFQRRRILESQGGEYDRLCLGRPLPDDEFAQCKAYQSRLNSCIGSHNASLSERNRLAGVWQDGKNCLLTRGGAFRARVINWVNDIVRPWTEDVRKALANSCDPLVSVTATAAPPTIGPRKNSVLSAIPKYSNSGPGSKPCPTTYKWTPSQTGMGLLITPSDRQQTTFQSSGMPGSQDFRVAATDNFSTKVGGVVVTVAGGVRCLVERHYDPGEDTTTCNYSCPFHGVFSQTHAGDVPCPEFYDDQ